MAPRAPDFLVAGHVVQDLLPDGTWRLGGAAAYASLLASRCGLQTVVLTSCGPDLDLDEHLDGIERYVVPSEATTQFRNVYEAGRREQWVPQRASVLTAADLPDEWRGSRIVLLGPVAGEVDASLAGVFSDESLVGVGAQGWLREVGSDSLVVPIAPGEWDSGGILGRADALFVSDEDVSDDEAQAALTEWTSIVDVVAFTRGYGGADVCYQGEWRNVGPANAAPVDLTGAGDTFAAGFLIRYSETGDPWVAARFGAAAASLVIEAEGVAGVPTREAVEERLAE
jgi:sugar/nucleoside kinase (ribokinase family)